MLRHRVERMPSAARAEQQRRAGVAQWKRGRDRAAAATLEQASEERKRKDAVACRARADVEKRREEA
jgi:hypothetical protein